MFDVQTAELLEAAPAVPGLDPAQLPQLLTRHYAQLVARRLRGSQRDDDEGTDWPLERVADVYEIMATVSDDPEVRRPAAFVAGTAQQILARESELAEQKGNPMAAVGRDQVSATLSAALLFFIAEQYADAYEAGGLINTETGSAEVRRLALHVRDLVCGRVEAILGRSSRPGGARPAREGRIEERAFNRLAGTLADGIEHLARYVLSEPVDGYIGHRRQAQRDFKQVFRLSSNEASWGGLAGVLRTSYPGPAQLAALLLAASGGLADASLTRLPPPAGSDEDFWKGWLRFRAQSNPYVWQNHREAIAEDFHQVGRNAVLVLPTGAGKTTVSTLKIASTLASGKKVIFLAPTHALAEQVTDDLQGIFPADRFGMKVSGEFDSLLLEGSTLQNIEVMTPEQCLAMLSYSPDSFCDVGLLVFDECHLLSPQTHKIGRALDGMLCLLEFCEQVPYADLLFLSAMLKNAQEFGDWITSLTGRDCAVVELLWKPSRQARGVVVYRRSDISTVEAASQAIQLAMDEEGGKAATGLRVAAKRALTAQPFVVWGLRHNWAAVPDARALTALSTETFALSGKLSNRGVVALPNANETAARIAVAAAGTGAKSIIFVNTKPVSVSTAKDIAEQLAMDVVLNERETALWSTIQTELGHARHSVFGNGAFGAVPHNAAMLRIERMLSEQLYKRSDGAMAIVATPTLAQGLNLPAQIAVLAGDKRAADEGNGREDLQAHELLNAAARAGRAGHLANGVVLLVPEPLVTFRNSALNDSSLLAKLRSVLPEDDRCVTITDPLERILDRIAEGETDDTEVRYTVNRLATLASVDGDPSQMDALMARSFGAYKARQLQQEDAYLEKVLGLWTEVQEEAEDEWDSVVVGLASKTGLPLDLLERLRNKLDAAAADLPTSVVGWVHFIFGWLQEDVAARDHLMAGVREAALKATGAATTSKLMKSTLVDIEPAVMAWLHGEPLNAIERILKGDPDAKAPTKAICPRARELASTFVVRGVSFIAGVVARMVMDMDLTSNDDPEASQVVQSLAAAVRRGFDSPEKLAFANGHPQVLGRVELHRLYAAENSDDAPGFEDDY